MKGQLDRGLGGDKSMGIEGQEPGKLHINTWDGEGAWEGTGAWEEQ